MTQEQARLSAKIDRELLALDQKIERQAKLAATASDALHDLHGTRRALLAAHEALHVREAAQ